MPLFDMQCSNTKCLHEFEDFLMKFSDPNPICPLCGCKNVDRFIGRTHGRVELSGQELTQSIKDGAKALQRKAAKNETFMGNLLGESKMDAIHTKGK